MFLNNYDEKSDWTLPDNPQGDWQVLTVGEAEKLLAPIEGQLGCVLAVRARPLTFYPKHLLLQVMVELGPGEARRRAIVSFLAGQNLICLGGTSVPIHRLNEELHISIGTPEMAEEYLRFFSSHVRGDGGVFEILDDVEQIRWDADHIPDTLKADVAKAIQPLQRKPELDSVESFAFHVTIQYNRHLFEADMEVDGVGSITMLEDWPIGFKNYEGLPIVGHMFDGPYRFVDGSE